VLRCDSKDVRLEGLSVIRTVLRMQEKDKRPVWEFVRVHGEAVLDSLDSPEHHRLIYELTKIPQIDERIDCMVFRITFEESFRACDKNLTALRLALDMLNAKRGTIRKCFNTAHKLGLSLNRESNAPKAQHGFALSTLEKLSQTKSTKMPKLSILHFVLALMSKDDARELFNPLDLLLLQNANALKTHKVYQDCVDLAQGIYSVQQISETGMYPASNGQEVKIEKRRKSLAPHMFHEVPQPFVTSEELDTDDKFHEVMRAFVDDNLESAEKIAERALNIILTYKELALYFDDLRSVYPPPKKENDSTKDLCDIFYRFASNISKHREEVEQENLRELIAASSTAGDLVMPARSLAGLASPRQSLQMPSPSPTKHFGTAGSPPADGAIDRMHFGTPMLDADSPAHGFRNGLVERVVQSEIDLLEKSMRNNSSDSLES